MIKIWLESITLKPAVSCLLAENQIHVHMLFISVQSVLNISKSVHLYIVGLIIYCKQMITEVWVTLKKLHEVRSSFQKAR